jgi:hypothetical protein
MPGRGSAPLPRFNACRLPRRLVLVSSTNGCQASWIIWRTGASRPDSPGWDIKFFRKDCKSIVIGIFLLVCFSFIHNGYERVMVQP